MVKPYVPAQAAVADSANIDPSALDVVKAKFWLRCSSVLMAIYVIALLAVLAKHPSVPESVGWTYIVSVFVLQACLGRLAVVCGKSWPLWGLLPLMVPVVGPIVAYFGLMVNINRKDGFDL